MCDDSYKRFWKIVNSMRAGDEADAKCVEAFGEFMSKHNLTWIYLTHRTTGDTVLHMAARLDKCTVLKHFTPILGVDVINVLGKTPLHEAAQANNVRAAEILLDEGANVNATTVALWTPLHLACNDPDSLRLVQVLLENGASTKFTNRNGWRPLHVACRAGNEDIVRILLSQAPGSPCTTNGRTPLHIACLHGHIEVVRILLEQDPNPAHLNLKDSAGTQPLHDAVCSGSEGVLELVLNDFILDSPNGAGWSPLHLAAARGHEHVVQKLVDRGASVDLHTIPDRFTALHCAARNGQVQVLRLLKELGARDLQDIHNRLPQDYLPRS